MNFWKIKKGNTSIQEIPVKNKKGELIENLCDVKSALFVIKKTYDSEALITKTKDKGIQLDMPSTGILTIILDPNETEKLPMKKYFMALQLKWTNKLKYEVIFKIDGQESDRMEILDQMIE